MGNCETVSVGRNKEDARMVAGNTHPILLVVHDDLLEGHQGPSSPGPGAMYLARRREATVSIKRATTRYGRPTYPNVPSPSLLRIS